MYLLSEGAEFLLFWKVEMLFIFSAYFDIFNFFTSEILQICCDCSGVFSMPDKSFVDNCHYLA